MAPGPVEGDSQSSADSSLSSVPADAFNALDEAPALTNFKSPTPEKMAKFDKDTSPASGDTASASQPQEVASIVVADSIDIPPESTGENQQSHTIPLPEAIPARATRSSTKPKVTIKLVKKIEQETEDPRAQDEIMVKGKTNGSIRSLLQSKWTETNVLTGSGKKSPLSGEDSSKLRDILASDPACDSLPALARGEVLSMLPAHLHRRDPNDDQIKPNAFALRNCDDFRADAVRFKEDLENGYHTYMFLENAVHARWQRSWHQRDGEAVKAFKHEWGVDLPEEVLPAGIESGRLREARKPVDLRRFDEDEEMDVFLEAKATMEETKQMERNKRKSVGIAEVDRPVPIVRYAPPKSTSAGGEGMNGPRKPKHKIALVKVPYDASKKD